MTDEEQAAAALDAEISATLRGVPSVDTDPGVLWLAAAIRTPAPRTVHRRIARTMAYGARRLWTSFRAVAAVLALLFMIHGVSGFFAGEWIATNLGEPFSRHAAFEAGLAFIAAAAAVVAGVMRRRWAPVSVATGTPLGVLLAVHGAREIVVFPYGAALHLAEGALAVALLVIWLRIRRYGRRRSHEEKL